MATKKKNLKESALYRELNYDLLAFLKAMLKLGFTEKTKLRDMYDSDAYCWLEDEPSEEDMDKMLKELGY